MSIVMPVFNGLPFLPAAIDSILTQSFEAFELIVVDDASSDSSVEVALSYAKSDGRVRVISHQRNEGIVAALNTGLNSARAPLIARLDQDDIALPDRIEKQVNYFRTRPDLALLGSNLFIIDTQGEIRGLIQYPETHERIEFALLLNNALPHPAAMYRAQPIKDHKIRYREQYAGAEDYDLWVTMMMYGRLHNLQSPLVKYRVHARQMSNTHRAQQIEAADNIGNALLRKLTTKALYTWREKQALLTLFRQYEREYFQDKAEANRRLLNGSDPETSDETLSGLLKRFRTERTLQGLASCFLRQRMYSDPVLDSLAKARGRHRLVNA